MLILKGSKHEYKVRLVRSERQVFELNRSLSHIRARRIVAEAVCKELRDSVDQLKEELAQTRQELADARATGLMFMQDYHRLIRETVCPAWLRQ